MLYVLAILVAVANAEASVKFTMAMYTDDKCTEELVDSSCDALLEATCDELEKEAKKDYTIESWKCESDGCSMEAKATVDKKDDKFYKKCKESISEADQDCTLDNGVYTNAKMTCTEGSSAAALSLVASVVVGLLALL